MRAKVLVFATCCCASFAGAQAPQKNSDANSAKTVAALTDREVIFYLVDASGSISKEDYDAVQTKIQNLIDELPDSTLASISFFGGKPETTTARSECDELISIEQPKPVRDIRLDFPPQGGRDEDTAIGKALEAVLEGNQDNGSVVLFTDGKEECSADFVSIRTKYLDTKITVIPVPEGTTIPLELLQFKPAGAFAPAVPRNVMPSIQFRSEINSNRSAAGTKINRSWTDANPFEKYLWFIGYFLFAGSAVALGLRYNKISIEIQSTIDEWRTYQRKQIDPQVKDPDNKVPKELDEESLKASTVDRKAISIGLLLLAMPIILCLGLLDGLSQWVSQLFLSGMIAAACLWCVHEWFLPLFPKWIRRLTGSGKFEPMLPTRLEWRVGLAAGMLALLVLGWCCVDFDQARKAAWFVLASNFSTALAVVAAGPFLFLGAQWFESKKGLATYFTIESQALSTDTRQKREAARRAKEELQSLQRSLDRVNFSNSAWGLGQLSAIFEPTFNRRARAVEKGIKEILVKQAGEKPDEEAAMLFRDFVESYSPDQFLKAAVALPNIDEAHRSHLESLIEALSARSPTRVRDTMRQVADYYGAIDRQAEQQ